MILDRINPPAYIDDFNQAQRLRWSRFLSDHIDRSIRRFDVEQFYNPTWVDTADDMKWKEIGWTAFPKELQVRAPSDRARWRRADSSRHFQDEYCEWSVERDPETDNIIRVTFTSEGPEYWQELAKNRGKLLQLYRELVSPRVRLSDLFTRRGFYNPSNRWNDRHVWR